MVTLQRVTQRRNRARPARHGARRENPEDDVREAEEVEAPLLEWREGVAAQLLSREPSQAVPIHVAPLQDLLPDAQQLHAGACHEAGASLTL